MAEMLHGIPMDYEPKRKNRFILEFPTELGIEVWKIQSVKRPELNINPVEIHYMNKVNTVAGKGKWAPMDITAIDTIGPSTSTQLMDWVRLCFETITGREGYKAGYAKTLVLKQLDPVGIEVEKWELVQCWVTDANFGENAHEDDGLAMVNFTIQPYDCILNY
jgi:hypothetical protein